MPRRSSVKSSLRNRVTSNLSSAYFGETMTFLNNVWRSPLPARVQSYYMAIVSKIELTTIWMIVPNKLNINPIKYYFYTEYWDFFRKSNNLIFEYIRVGWNSNIENYVIVKKIYSTYTNLISLFSTRRVLKLYTKIYWNVFFK